MFIFIIKHLLLCMICLHESAIEGPKKLSHEFFVGFIWSNNNRDHRAHCQRNYKIVRHSPKRWEWRKCWLMPVKFMGRNFLILIYIYYFKLILPNLVKFLGKAIKLPQLLAAIRSSLDQFCFRGLALPAFDFFFFSFFRLLTI